MGKLHTQVSLLLALCLTVEFGCEEKSAWQASLFKYVTRGDRPDYINSLRLYSLALKQASSHDDVLMWCPSDVDTILWTWVHVGQALLSNGSQSIPHISRKSPPVLERERIASVQRHGIVKP